MEWLSEVGIAMYICPNPIAAHVRCADRFRFRGETREIEAKIVLLGIEKEIFACFAKEKQLRGNDPRRLEYQTDYEVVFKSFGLLMCRGTFL